MPEQQKPARRHHVVSKFYLRRFTNPRQQLMRHPLDGKAHLQSVNDATVRKDFYTLHLPGVDQDTLEAHLGELETEAGKAFTAILRDGSWPPTPEDRLAVSAWIGLQFLRGENNRRSVEEIHRTLSKLEVGIATTDQLRKDLGMLEDTPDDEVEAARARMLATADTRPIDHHLHLAAMADMLESAVQLVFDRRPWLLIDFSWDALGTSDTPVALVPDAAARAGHRGVGIGTAEELYVPLSTRTALCVGNVGGTKPDRRGPGNQYMAQKLNQYTLHTARRAIYYHPETDPFAAFAMPTVRQRELNTSLRQINGMIEETARAQGRPSGLPTSTDQALQPGFGS
ncbi:DUF4238 domain-containing protein [Glycomyces sp. A-F 0318]|uniref:DUF4238 domain-containing protein n=1 Tax=Glycomyces amatae TaxID=2881355 RepID=UPI001E5BDF43|nr:DUF4238 domain-containing protein [Glycomyces amatae]MCD0446299.1 DUF4238 domain-containing protein [Glycomyces amatae]